MFWLSLRVLILTKVLDLNLLAGSSETTQIWIQMLSLLPAWTSHCSLWWVVCIHHRLYFNVNFVIQLFTLTCLHAGASDQNNKVPMPTNTVAPNDAANQQNAYAQSSNLMDLLRGSQENSPPSKIDVRALGKILFGGGKRSMLQNFILN